MTEPITCWGRTLIHNTQIFILARSSRYREHVHMRKIIKRLRQKKSGKREKKHTCALLHAHNSESQKW